jgi:hypothetical protein
MFEGISLLARALNGSDYRFNWSDTDPDVSGLRIQLHASGGKTNDWWLPRTVTLPDGHKTQSWHLFGPAEDRQSLIVVERSRALPSATLTELVHKGSERSFSIARVNLSAGPKTEWKHDRNALEKMVGGNIRELYLPPGPARPCRKLPIVILCDGPTGKGPLWTIDTLAGEMDGPFPLPWGSILSGTLSLLDPKTYATRDGRFVVSIPMRVCDGKAACRLRCPLFTVYWCLPCPRLACSPHRSWCLPGG